MSARSTAATASPARQLAGFLAKYTPGGGKRVRHIRLSSPATLEKPAVRSLSGCAVFAAAPPFSADGPPRTVIRAISARQRPRRPR